MIKEIYFETIDSTNKYLKENYESMPNLTFVRANYQTNGRGRMGRTWVGKANDSLMFSLLIKDQKLIKNFSSMSVSAAVSISKVLEELGLDKVQIKWPNDVYVNGKKICGILLEGSASEYIVIGIGININNTYFPEDLIHPATSIKLETEKELNIEEIKDLFYSSLLNELNNIDNKEYLVYVNNHNYLLNKECYALINGNKQLVKAGKINIDNTLEVIYDKQTYNVLSDEITFHL